MIDYDYPDLFITEGTQKELLITDGTVSVIGTSYVVSDETVLFENGDLELEAFELSQSLNSEMQLTFGSCESAHISFAVRQPYVGSIVGTVVKVYLIPNHDASKMLQLGVFKIHEDQQSNDHQRHSLVGYDAMYDILNSDVSTWYDGVLPDEDTSVTLVDFRDSFLDHFGVTAELVSLINDDITIKRTIEVTTEEGYLIPLSGADIIKAICEINAVFGVITNEGKFRFVSLTHDIEHDSPTTDLPVTQCIEVQDYEPFYPIKRLYVRTKDYTAFKSWGIIVDPVNTYDLAYNPLIDDYDTTSLFDVSDNIFGAIEEHGYTPCEIQAIGNPLHEVGDPIKVYKKNGEVFYTYILERQMRGVQALRDTYRANGEAVWEKDLNSTSAHARGGGSSSGGGGTTDHSRTAWKLRSAVVDDETGERYYTYLTKNKYFIVSNNRDAGHDSDNDRTEECTIGQSANPWKAGYFKDLFMDGARVVANFPEIIRNIGFRLLDEPSNVSIEYEEVVS